MHLNYVTNGDLCNIIHQNIWKIPHNIDGIICIPRGGLFVGTIISEFLHKPIYTVDSFLAGISLGSGLGMNNDATPPNPYGTYIVVDDSASSGDSFTKAAEALKDHRGTLLYTAVICDEFRAPDNVNIILSSVQEPRIFELNLFRLWFLSKCILDIDGVLCVDPAPGLDLDEDKYIDHILNAAPTVHLGQPAMALCTHRLIKYAPQTQQWLRQNEIEYGVLHMLAFGSIQEKIEKMDTPEYLNMKTTVYDQYQEAQLFIESNWDEAQRIYRNLHRPVLCTDRNILLQD